MAKTGPIREITHKRRKIFLTVYSPNTTLPSTGDSVIVRPPSDFNCDYKYCFHRTLTFLSHIYFVK